MTSGRSRPQVPFITTDQMRKVDRAMVEEYGISLIQMMENAGRNLAHRARSRFLNGDPTGQRVLVLAGKGGNGGGGLVCARRLHSWGAKTLVYLSAPASRMTEATHHQLAALRHTNIPVEVTGNDTEIPSSNLIVDALIGYGLRDAPRGGTADLIQAANEHSAPTLALDVPSGLDATTGVVYHPAIRAAATLTLALPKQGLASQRGREYVGELYLADIGVPPELYERSALRLRVDPMFAEEEIIRLW